MASGRMVSARRLFLCSVFFVTSLFAAGAAYALTISEAREEALRVNLDVKLSREKAAEASSVRRLKYTDFFAKLDSRAFASHAEPEPHVNVKRGEYGTFSSGPVPSSDRSVLSGEQNTYGIGVKLDQPLFQGGRIYNTYRQSLSSEEAAGYDEKKTAQEILLKTESAYIDLLKAEELKRAAEQHIKTIEAHMKDMQLLFARGRASQNDVLKVKVELARAEETLILTENDMQIAAGRLNTILDRPFSEKIDPAPLPDTKWPEITPKEAESLALINRPDLKSAFGRNREAIFKRKVSEADFYPGVNFVSEYIHQTEQPTVENDEWSVTMRVEYRLWDWGGRSHNVEAARSAERQKYLEVLSVESGIYSDVQEALLNVRAADKRVEVSKEALNQAQENLRITEFGFEHGAKTSTEVLDAEDLKTKTGSEYIQARYDSHHSRAVFRYAIGLMDKESIGEEAPL